jgi:hypothetical protein
VVEQLIDTLGGDDFADALQTTVRQNVERNVAVERDLSPLWCRVGCREACDAHLLLTPSPLGEIIRAAVLGDLEPRQWSVGSEVLAEVVAVAPSLEHERPDAEDLLAATHRARDIVERDRPPRRLANRPSRSGNAWYRDARWAGLLRRQRGCGQRRRRDNERQPVQAPRRAHGDLLSRCVPMSGRVHAATTFRATSAPRARRSP